LAPVLIQKAFKKPEYFKHFIDLVELFNICLQFEISQAEVEKLHTGFKKWVQDYEQLVFSFNPCTPNGHDDHFLTESTIKITQSDCLPAHCQSTLSFTLQTTLKAGDQSGVTGHSLWNASVGSSSLEY
jgi:hypothetical protein